MMQRDDWIRAQALALTLEIPVSVVIEVADRLQLPVRGRCSLVAPGQQDAIERELEKLTRVDPRYAPYTHSALQGEARNLVAAGVPKAWLRYRTTIEQMEQSREDRGNRPNPLPAGLWGERWQALKRLLSVGDELWVYCSPAESWQHRAGRAGVAIVRQGYVIASLLTALN
jgi:hypothetical protein